MFVIYGHVVYEKGMCNTKGKWFKLKLVQLEKLYMGKVRNQDNCHTAKLIWKMMEIENISYMDM